MKMWKRHILILILFALFAGQWVSYEISIYLGIANTWILGMYGMMLFIGGATRVEHEEQVYERQRNN